MPKGEGSRHSVEQPEPIESQMSAMSTMVSDLVEHLKIQIQIPVTPSNTCEEGLEELQRRIMGPTANMMILIVTIRVPSYTSITSWTNQRRWKTNEGSKHFILSNRIFSKHTGVKEGSRQSNIVFFSRTDIW